MQTRKTVLSLLYIYERISYRTMAFMRSPFSRRRASISSSFPLPLLLAGAPTAWMKKIGLVDEEGKKVGLVDEEGKKVGLVEC